MLHWQRQVVTEFSRIDGEVLVFAVESTLDNQLLSVGGRRDAVANGASKTADVEVIFRQPLDNFAGREPGRDGAPRP